MNTTEQNRFNKEYILSLPFEDGVKHLLDIMDNDYKYKKDTLNEADIEMGGGYIYQKGDDKEHDTTEDFLNQECFIPYYDEILK